jgi:signal transduction histidine kinase
VFTAAVGDVRSGRVRLTVTDTGAGIAPELQEKIFSDFFTTKPDGTGLGLSIVRRMVMDLDGTIALESEPGRGSRFVIELPAAAPEVKE